MHLEAIKANLSLNIFLLFVTLSLEITNLYNRLEKSDLSSRRFRRCLATL